MSVDRVAANVLEQGRCPARRIHPLSSDFYVQCVRSRDHLGSHQTADDFTWDDTSAYVLPPKGADNAAR